MLVVCWLSSQHIEPMLLLQFTGLQVVIFLVLLRGLLCHSLLFICTWVWSTSERIQALDSQRNSNPWVSFAAAMEPPETPEGVIAAA